MKPKIYHLRYSGEAKTWKPVVVHFHLKGSLGDAVPLDPDFKITQTEGASNLLQVTDSQVKERGHTGEFTVGLLPGQSAALERLLLKQGTQRFVFTVKARPALVPVLPGMPAGTVEAAFDYAGTCTVEVAPPPRLDIKQKSNTADAEWTDFGKTLVVDSTVEQPALVRAVFRVYEDFEKRYKAVRGAVHVKAIKRAVPDAVEIKKKELDSFILQIAVRARRFMIGPGDLLDAVELRFHPNPKMLPELKWEKPPTLRVQVRTAPVQARIEVYQRRKNRKVTLLAASTETLTSERVAVRLQPQGTPPDWNSLYVNLTILSPSPRFAASHHVNNRAWVGTDGRAAFDLRTTPDTYGPETECNLSLPDMAQEGIWMLVAGKLGWETIDAVSVRDLGVEEAGLKALLEQGGHMRVKVHGTFQPEAMPGVQQSATPWPDVPVHDLRGDLQVKADEVATGRCEIDPKDKTSYLVFEIGGGGPKTVTTRTALPLHLEPELEDVLQQVLHDAAEIDPRVFKAAETYGQAVVQLLAARTHADLEEIYPWLLNRLATIRDYFGFSTVVGEGIDLALDLREQIVMRQLNNLIEAVMELASVGASKGYTWWKGKQVKEAVEGLAEQSIKETVQQQTATWSDTMIGLVKNLDETLAEQKTVQRELKEAMATLETLVNEKKVASDNLLQRIVDLNERSTNLLVTEHTLRDAQPFLREQLDACTRVTRSNGDAFYEHLHTLLDTLKEREEQLPALMTDIQQQVRESIGPSLNRTIERVREVRQRLVSGVRTLPPETGTDIIRTTSSEQTQLLASVDRHLARLEKLAAPNEIHVEVFAIEANASHLGQLTGNAAAAAKDFKSDYDQQVTHAQPYELYKDTWFPRTWYLLDKFTAWLFSWYGIRATIEALTYAASLVVGYVARALQWVIELIESWSPTMSHLEPDAFEHGQRVARRLGLKAFTEAMEHQQQELKAVSQKLDPAKLSGTFARSETAAKKSTEKQAAQQSQQEALALLKHQARLVLVEACTRTLDVKLLDEPMLAPALDRFRTYDALARMLLTRLQRYEHGLTLSNQDFLAWWPQVWDVYWSGGGGVLSWQDVDNTVEWATFSASWTLRAGAVVGAFTGVGAVAGGGLLLGAEALDQVGVALRLAIASAGSLREVNAIPADLLVTLALCYDQVFNQPDLDS